MNLLNHALYYAGIIDWPVFPCRIDGKPMRRKGYREATKDPYIIKAWWTANPHASIGIPTGKVSGIIALNVNGRAGSKDLEELERKHGQLPITAVLKTGGNERQYLFNHPGLTIKNGKKGIGPILDIRGDGGHIIAPPSLHPSGKQNHWLSTHPIADVPNWLMALITGVPGYKDPADVAVALCAKLGLNLDVYRSRVEAESYICWLSPEKGGNDD